MKIAALLACAPLAAACSSTPATGPGGLHVGDTIEFGQEAPRGGLGATSSDGMGWNALLRFTYSRRCVVAGWEGDRVVLEGEVEGANLIDLGEITLTSVACPHE